MLVLGGGMLFGDLGGGKGQAGESICLQRSCRTRGRGTCVQRMCLSLSPAVQSVPGQLQEQ